MEKPDVAALAKKMIEATGEYVSKAVAPLRAHIAELQAKIAAIPAGQKGEKGDPGESICGKDGAPGAKGDTGPAGKDATVEQIQPLVALEVARAVSAIQKPKDGAPGASGERGDAGPRGEIGPAGESVKGDPGKDGRDGKDGASIHPDTVALMVREHVEKAIAALPRPKDGEPGRDAAELTVLPGIDETRSYPAGTYAKYNGGEIRAERRTDPIKDGDLAAAGWTVTRDGVAAIVFTQGEDPREITCAAMLTSGTKTVTPISVPMPIYKEVWREGEYVKGDVVTWGGSAWHCQQKTTDKPGTSSAWRMMVKEGRPGKDAEKAAPSHKVVGLR